MIIAITGGSGFIGRILVKKSLENNYKVRLLSRKSLPENEGYIPFKGDLSDPKVDLSNFLDGVDILYHCAGEVINEALMNELHVNGTKRLIKQAKGKVGRWVQLSSVGAYGKCRSGVVTEKTKEQPLGVYETTKTESDNLVKASGIPYLILRPSNVFGDNMTNQSLHNLFSMIQKGLFFYIGKKGSMLNYIHVDDVVEALVKCGENENITEEVFNISQSIILENLIVSLLNYEGKNTTFIRLPEWLVRLFTGLFKVIPKFPLTSSKIDALTLRSVYDSNKIQNLLDFQFKNSLEDDFKSFYRT